MSEQHAPGDTDNHEETPTPEERLVELEAENQALQAEILRTQADRDNAAAVDERLKAAEAENIELRKTAGKVAISDSIRTAAETLGVSPEYAVQFYSHKFKSEPDGKGGFVVSPNPTELLARAKESDPLMKQVTATAQQRKADNSAVVNVEAAMKAGNVDGLNSEQAVGLMAALGRDPERKAAFIEKHGGPTYLKLASRASRAKSTG